MAAPPKYDPPLSPFLTVWRWHITMFASIVNRMAGVGLYLGAFGLVIWLWALAAGPAMFDPLAALLRSTIGQIALFLLAVASAFHFAAGVRHLVWDAGRGFRPKTADATAWFAIIFAALAPIGLWALAGAGK